MSYLIELESNKLTQKTCFGFNSFIRKTILISTLFHQSLAMKSPAGVYHTRKNSDTTAHNVQTKLLTLIISVGGDESYVFLTIFHFGRVSSVV